MPLFDDPQQQQTRGVFGNPQTGPDTPETRVQEAKGFLQNMNPENSQALIMAGLSLLQGQDIGTAGLRAFDTRNQLQQQGVNNRVNQRRLRLAERNADISESNAAVAIANAQRLAAQRNDPMSAAGKAFSDLQAIRQQYGAGSQQEKDFLAFNEKSGLGLDFNEDGSIKAVRFGKGAQNGFTNSVNSDLQRSALQLEDIQTQSKALLKSVKEASPYDFGAVGAVRQTLGGLFGQVGLEGIESVIRPDGTVRQEARLTGLMLARALIQETRITDPERELVAKAIDILSNDSSKQGAIKALETIDKVSNRLAPLANRRAGFSNSNSPELDMNTLFQQALDATSGN